MDFEQARFNMIEQQIRTWNVLDQAVLELLREIPREHFVDDSHRTLAFADFNLPLAHGQVMMQPKVEARLFQALALTNEDRVLEIGTGSGYMTALLAARAASVTSVELFSELSRRAGERLHAAGLAHVELATGDGATGWPDGGPYDVIVITGSLPHLPSAFGEALNQGGRLAAIIGEAPSMEAILYRKTDACLHSKSLFDTHLPALVNAPETNHFTF